MGKKKNQTKQQEIKILNDIDIEKHNEKDELRETLNNLKENNVVNPDLKEFFEEVNKKKEELEENIDYQKESINDNKEQIVKEKPMQKDKDCSIKNFFFVLALIVGLTYYIIYVLNVLEHVNYMQEIINSTLLVSILIGTTLSVLGNKKIRNIFGSITAILIISLVSVNMLVSKNIIKLPTLAVMKDFKGVSLIDTMNWAQDNNIELEKKYEYSDNIKEGFIITQDVIPNTLLKKIKKLVVTVSEGPNYDKELILSNMVGLKLDNLEKFIKENHLKNVKISYQVNEDIEKDTIISQSNKGQMKRNDPVSFILSLGSNDSIVPIKIKDLTNIEEFEATLYLMKNGIKSAINYDYSDTIKRGYVISQDKNVDELINPKVDIVSLKISKGKKIVVPDFSNKTINDVVNWITKNNLKVTFIDSYNLTIPNGELIDIDYKPKDIISEGTKVTINVSKGALTVPKFNSLAEFFNWVSSNNISYSQDYAFNDNVRKGEIIKVSKNTGDKINPVNEKINVTISYGSPVTIPYFINSSKSQIYTKCRQLGLSCGFTYAGYSNSISKDIAIAQNKIAGSKVISGTGITITLSKGNPQKFHIYVSEAWLGKTSDSTINNLNNKLRTQCPDVNFVFVKKAHNTISSGMFHPDSPVKGGDQDFIQGQTYIFWIVQ